jgi:hypothetical protein
MNVCSTIKIPKSVERVLNSLITGIEKIKSNFIEGVYLTGSIPLNDFHLNKSDIDFIILCRGFSEQNVFEQLKKFHRKIQRECKRPKLSGFYLTKKCLQMSTQQTIKVPSVFEGKMTYANWGGGLTAVTLKELKTTAITIFGAPANELPIEIKDEELNRILIENINSYWRNWINKHSPLRYRYLFLIMLPWLTEWSVLGVARQLYTLKTGGITSKLNAGFYALEILPNKYHEIIWQAIEIRKSGNKLLHISPSIKRGTANDRVCNVYD